MSFHPLLPSPTTTNFTRPLFIFPKKLTLFSTNGSRKDLSDEELLKLAGSQEKLNLALESSTREKAEEILELPYDMPHRPKILMDPPIKGKRNYSYHRFDSEILRSFREDAEKKFEIDYEKYKHLQNIKDDPVPWTSLKPIPEPIALIDMPPRRKLFSDIRFYNWKRENYIPAIGDIYPDTQVEVTVTITNDPQVVEDWASERIEDGIDLYGFETKWWTYEERGAFYSDSIPGIWSDLALLQIASEKDIILIQPLDMPVEKLGPKIRHLLKFKWIKKNSFFTLAKVRGLKMCQIQMHGCHDCFELIKANLGISSKKKLPSRIAYQDLASMSKFLIGLDLDPELSVTANWESDYLEESWIELAAKEAWSNWVLYGILTRLDINLVKLWNRWIPETVTHKFIDEQRIKRKELLASSSIVLDHVFDEELQKEEDKKTPWKKAKESVVDLMNEVGMDLYDEVDQNYLNQKKI